MNEVDTGPVVVSVASQVTVVAPIGNVPDAWSQVTGPTSFSGIRGGYREAVGRAGSRRRLERYAGVAGEP